jgi:hypothetical protein
MATDLKTQMLERLIKCGAWMLRDELVRSLSTCAPAIEDALADLVIEGKAEYRPEAGYRLTGSVLVRRAAHLRQRKGLAKAVYGEQVGKEYRVGVAEMKRLGHRNEVSLVLYEMAMPMPPAGDIEAHQRQVQGIINFS